MKINLQLFAGTLSNVKIYSNDGNTLLFSGNSSGNNVMTVTETGETGITTDMSAEPYTYSGTGTFRGFSGTANSTTPDLPIGYSDTVDNIKELIGVAEYETEVTLYVVDVAASVTYEHLLKDNHKVQVDSAIRDGNGVKIDTNYSLKSATVSNVSYDSTNKQIQKTINGTTTDVVTFGSNAFNSTTIPTTTDSVTQSSTAALTSGGAYTALSGKEATSNKVTSISSSSTDTQYPSAKLLYDQLALKQNVLSSGVNIKTINNESIMGQGNISTPTISQLLDSVYPVGSIYITVSTGTTGSSSPASFLGGTWQRLPDGYTLWTASSGVYDGSSGTIAAGLPNIIGTATQVIFRNSDFNVTGAFTGTSSLGNYWDSNSGSSYQGTRYILTFDASKSNSIYKNNYTTVQPPAIKVYMWRRTA